MMWGSVSDSIATVLTVPATRRLMSDLMNLIKSPIPYANASPIDEADLRIWKCVVQGRDGPYNGIPIYFTLEFPSDYPNSAPHAYFNSPITYHGGAQVKDAKGRSVVCLDLFGNFSKIHTEWGSSASGWSPSYTVSTILLQMQSAIMDTYLDKSSKSVELVRNFKVPDELLLDIPTGDAMKTVSTPSIQLPMCYVTRELISKSGEIFCYGVTVPDRPNGSLTSPCEHLSVKAFVEGTRKSSTNREFGEFLPLYIKETHWTSDTQTLFCESIDKLYRSLKRPDIPNYQKPFVILSSLMNSSVVEVMNAKDHATANDKFIDGYFAFYRLLVEMTRLFPKLITYANTQIEQFLTDSSKRSKNTVPNLGEWLILLLVADKYEWKDVAHAFMEECDVRNVYWYVQGSRTAPGRYRELANTTIREGRTLKVFEVTPISRHLVCFQIKFIQDAKTTNLKLLDENYGLTPVETKTKLKEIYNKIVNFKNWEEHFRWCGVEPVSDEIRCDQLIEAVKISNTKGYTNSSSSGGRKYKY